MHEELVAESDKLLAEWEEVRSRQVELHGRIVAANERVQAIIKEAQNAPDVDREKLQAAIDLMNRTFRLSSIAASEV